MQFKAGFYANRMYTVCHTVAYSSSRNIYCHVLSELLKFLSLFAEIVTLLLILILLMNGQMVMEKIKSKGYDTVSDVVESKVHQCQQNSDA